MPLIFLRVATILFALIWTASSVLAQEAIEKSPSTDETSSEATATPKPSRAKDEETPKKAPEKPAKSLEETMRPEEFKSAGLDKLNEDELQHLDAYLQGYRESAKKKAAEQAKAQAQDEIKKANEKAEQAEKATEEVKKNAASARTKLDSLVSRVDGTIDGVKSNTQIRLEDGTVWKVTNPDEHYRASVTDHPAAVVLHTTFGYKMQIEGMPAFYVDPVVRP